MDTTKPLLICPACDQPVWPGDPMSVFWPENEETGEPAGPMQAYHRDCAPDLGHSPPR